MSRRSIVIEVLDEFLSDDCTRFAAAISYYAVFSVPAILALAALALGLFLGPGELEQTILESVSFVVSEQAAEAVEPVLRRVEDPLSGGPLSWALAGLALVFGATGAFMQVQAALNRAWYVQPAGGTIRSFFVKRVSSFLLLSALAILLLAALGSSAVILSAGREIADRFVDPIGEGAMIALDLAVSLGVLTLLFGAVLWWLPDAEIDWKDVVGGALGTALLFWVGKSAIAFYLSTTTPARAFGVAGSLALFLLWIYYTAILLLLGAEWTQVRARRSGRPIRPSEGAALTPRGRQRARDDERERNDPSDRP
ncbi:MAG: YihY/virulence factor BrkB family protein [Gemmatimonadota bacterium]|nr:YihY/virulence factor BrkB family protein [Gemmatimonadota bacterium]